MRWGRMYAKEYFPPESKAAAWKKWWRTLSAAFRGPLNVLTQTDLRDEGGKRRPSLNTLYVVIRYTEHWQDYSAYEVKADDIFGNLVARGSLFVYHREVGRLGEGRWIARNGRMTPQTVNVVNLPLQNALKFSGGDSGAAAFRCGIKQSDAV